MRNTKKKGFTIVELVIVVAVIAILAAVLIPTISGIIKKANMSADQQAISQMNKALAMNDALEGTENILDVFAALEESGMSAENYKPITKDMFFFYDADLKNILYVDKDMKVVAPEEHKDVQYKAGSSTWLSLTQKIQTEAPNGYESKAAAVTVRNGKEFMYVVEDIRKNNNINSNGIEITLANDIDMMGASMNLYTGTDKNGDSIIDDKITIKSADASKPVKIYNATAVDVSKVGDGKTKGLDGQYGSALFPRVSKGGSLTLENVTFENIHVKNTYASGVGILVGINTGTVTLNNVTIKDSSVIGWRNTGALIGNASGGSKVNINGPVNLNNVDVKTVGGRSGMVFGIAYDKTVINASAKITLDKNCSYSIYECEQNTGAKYGLKGDKISSWSIDGDGNKDEAFDMNFNSKTLVSSSSATDYSSKLSGVVVDKRK